MSKSFFILMLIGLVITSANPGAAASPARIIQVNMYYLAPEDWGGEFHVWNQGTIIEVNPITHAAAGKYNWQLYNPVDGWRFVKSDVICVAFSPDGASAAFITRITEVMGWGQGAPGEYAYFWLKDGRLAGELDASAINNYSFDPFYEFWPAGDPPACHYFDPRPYDIPVDRGNIRFFTK